MSITKFIQMANATNDVEDGKLWLAPMEKHFIDILVEEELKGNMPQGQFKNGLWTSIVCEFNLRANKNYNREQLRQKYQRLKGRHRVFSQLLRHTGMGWDPIVNMIVGSEDAWASAIAVSAKRTPNKINYQSHLYQFLYK